MKGLFLFVGVLAGSIFMSVAPASAISLKVAPLSYKTELKKNEEKQAFIDVSNPSKLPVVVSTSVQAFEQINDDGGLRFYNDKQIQQGIKPELKKFELKGREAVRMYFTVDSAQLPKGDIFAAVFFTTDPKKPRNGVGQSVRVGTLLSIVNEEPGERSAEITKLDVQPLQFGSDITGSYAIKNTAPKDSRAAFYPEVTITSWPFGKSKEVEGSLVFPGRTRTSDLSLKSAGIGIHKVTVAYNDSSKNSWVVVIQPWILIVTGLVLAVLIVELLLHRRKRRSKRIRLS